MNLYELAVVEVAVVLREYDDNEPRVQRMANNVVDNLVAKGIIQSTEPGNLVPGGLDDTLPHVPPVHKATPIAYTEENETLCLHCGSVVKTVPGGQGMTWVHAATGAVAGTGSPRT